MSKNDQLDVVLKQSTAEELMELAEILGEENDLPEDHAERCEYLNGCVRWAYGHSFANVFRDEYEPNYKPIVVAVAEKLKIKVRQHYATSDLEDKILVEMIESAKEHMIKEKGTEAWRKIEKEAEEELSRLLAEGKIPEAEAKHLKGMKPGGMMAALLAGKLVGFPLYILANQVFFAVARFLGLRVGVAIAGPIIGKALAFLLGPAGWLIAGVWAAYELLDTNWRKTISAVVMVASLRRRHMYGL